MSRLLLLLLVLLLLSGACEPAGGSDPSAASEPASRQTARPPPSAAAQAGRDAGADTAGAGAGAGGSRELRAEKLTLIAGGDVNLGRHVGRLILTDPSYAPLAGVAPVLASGDLRFVNLESALSEQGGQTQSPLHRLVFTGPPGGAEVLRAAGIDVVSFANNHVWDYGQRGFDETLANLERVGIAYAGARREPDRQHEPTVVKVKGWSVAFFATTHIWNYGSYRLHPGKRYVAWAEPDELREPVTRALREHDLVLVSYHGGVEYADLPFGQIRDAVTGIMALGPHALLGHHPHVPRGVQWFGRRPALYSLGNLVFGGSPKTRWSAVSFLARLTFARDGGVTVEACPYMVRGHRPELLGGPHRSLYEKDIRYHLERISRPLGGVAIGPATEHSCMTVEPLEADAGS